MNIPERTALASIPGGADALAAIDTAAGRLADLTARSRAADQGVADAKQGRQTLIHRAAIGDTVPPATVAKADRAVTEAEGVAALAREAVQAGRVAATEAEGEGMALIAADRLQQFREAAERRIAAAEKLDRIGAEYAVAAAEFLAAGEALSPLLTFGAKSGQQMVSLRDRRLVRDAVPAAIQQAIVQTGSAVNAPIAPRERLIWR